MRDITLNEFLFGQAIWLIGLLLVSFTTYTFVGPFLKPKTWIYFRKGIWMTLTNITYMIWLIGFWYYMNEGEGFPAFRIVVTIFYILLVVYWNMSLNNYYNELIYKQRSEHYDPSSEV